MYFDADQSAHKALRDIVAERTKSIIVWIGSGLSVPAGLPTWKGLRDILCEAISDKARSMDAESARPLMEKRAKILTDIDFWRSFDVIKTALGDTSYRAVIRRALTPADRAAVPKAYNSIWKLRPRGVLNLNLDRLATRAFNTVRPGMGLIEFTGKEAGQSIHVLQSPSTFCANLHGISMNEDSWIMRQEDLSRLLNNQAYVAFITSCLVGNVSLFVGLTPEDRAVGGFLTNLQRIGADPGEHYWVTHRKDGDTDRWAESNGVRVIRYTVDTKNVHMGLDEFFDDIRGFVPHDTSPTPVAPTISGSGVSELLEPEELRKKSHEEIRLTLNGRAATILSSSDEDKYQKYSDFCRRYSAAIYDAWFVETEEIYNVLLGYTLVEEIAQGAFGRVFKAKSPSGESVAIKLLHSDVHKNQGMLQSFRRGVSSMQILSKHRVVGMIAYRQAFEIPACVVMELVEGPSLNDAVKSRQISDWCDILRIGCDLAEIVQRAHHLPERVLHRDIRPSNIMLRNFYVEQNNYEVVVLDFDLSWHRDAHEKSIVSHTASGYLAPEQISPDSRYSTRNAQVDSFGLGMTLYFLRTGTDPQANEHRSLDWPQVLRDGITKFPSPAWKSLPARFARLIGCATRDDQPQRWDMSQISAELNRMKVAHANPLLVKSAELLAEEFTFRSELGRSYKWDADKATASAVLPSGMVISVEPQESNRDVGIKIDWVSRGTGDRRKVGKYLGQAIAKATSELKQAGWTIDKTDRSPTSLSLHLSIHVNVLINKLDAAVKAFDRALNFLTID